MRWKTEEHRIRHAGRTYLIQCFTAGKGPRVFISAGMHGNEPAGVLALQKFMEDIGKYIDKFSFTIIPCINPVGRALNVRGNGTIKDLNRQFNAESPPEEVAFVKRCVNGKYVFSLDLHEDPTDEPAVNAPDEIPPEELYLYEISEKGKSKGRLILDALQKEFAICKKESIYREPCNDGLLWRDCPSTELPGTLEDFLAKHTTNAFTLETPTCWPLQKRVNAHLLAIDTALRVFQQDRE